MPLRLCWYILRELVKLLVLTTVVLVVVISVFAAAKPLMEGMLGAWELVKLIVYLMPGMLSYALPFAAGFAGTLVFYRMAVDNEITACATHGISYATLLTPVAALGIALTLAMFFLSNWVLPNFWRDVERILQQDVIRMVVDKLERGETVELGRLVVYADEARERVAVLPAHRAGQGQAITIAGRPGLAVRATAWGPVTRADLIRLAEAVATTARQAHPDLAAGPAEVYVHYAEHRLGQPAETPLLVWADPGGEAKPRVDVDAPQLAAAPAEPRPFNRIVLDGVAVGRLDRRSGQLRADYTARRAVLDLYRGAEDVGNPQFRPGQTYVTMMLTGVTINDPESGLLWTIESQPVEAQAIPSPFRQQPKFMSLPQLREMSRYPDRSDEVRELRTALAETMAAQRVISRVYSQLAGSERPRAELRGPQGGTYLLEAPKADIAGLELNMQAAADRPVTVRLLRGGLLRQRFEAERAELEVTSDELGREPRINLRLRTVAVIDPALPTDRGSKLEVFLPLLQLDRPVLGRLKELPSGQLLGEARSVPHDSVQEAATQLVNRINKLRRKILGQAHERAATAVTCMLALLLAAIMAMVLRSHVPLVIFFWSFLPTVVAILTISQGQNLVYSVRQPLIVGLVVTWLGCVMLTAISGAVYLRLRRT